MKYLAIVLLLVGCSTTVPVTRKFPEAPPRLLEPAPELKPIPPNTTDLSVMIDNAADNYTQYRNLRELYDAWQQWYREQKENFDSVK